MTDVLGWRALFGILGPSTNTVVQPEFDQMRPTGVTNHYSRIFTPNANAVSNDTFMNATLVIAIPNDWIDVQTIADLEEIAFEFKDKKKSRLRVATKYPNLTREFLFSKGVTQFKLVKSLGATEIYPFTGSSEIITDITSTGETLKANNLRILKDGEILKSQACLMISKKSQKIKGLKRILSILSK